MRYIKTKQVITCGLIISCLIMAGAVSSATADVRELSFRQAYGIMVEENDALKASGYDVAGKKELRNAARGMYLPKIWLDGRHTRIADDMMIDLNDIRQVMATLHRIPTEMLPSFETSVRESAFSNAGINFSWPVFTGGRLLAANRAAEASVRESLSENRQLEASLTTRLSERYFGYLVCKDAVRVYKQVLDGMARHMEQAEKLEENGMLAPVERIAAQAAHAEAERAYKKALRSAQIAQAGLKSILASTDDIRPVSPLFITREIDPVQEYLARAGQKNHHLETLAAGKDRAVQAYRAEKATYLPNLYLFGRYELYKDDLTLLEPEWAAGIGVSVPLFEGLSRGHNVAAARKRCLAVDHLVAQARQDINTLVEKKYNELMMALEQFESLNASLEFAREHLRVRRVAFRSGSSPSIDVVDAQLALLKVEIERLNTVYRFDVTLAELLEACGSSRTFESYQKKQDVEVLL